MFLRVDVVINLFVSVYGRRVVVGEKKWVIYSWVLEAFFVWLRR